MRGTPWPEERVKELRRLAAMGYSQPEAALAMGFKTRHAVSSKAQKLGIRFHGKKPGRPAGIKSRERAVPAVVRPVGPYQEPRPWPPHPTLTGRVFGDPPPGRTLWADKAA